MLQRNIENFSGSTPSWWVDLGHGAATLMGLASLCSQAIAKPSSQPDTSQLSDESLAILWLSRNRGTFEIRAQKDGFDSAERLLSVAVESEPGAWRLLLDKRDIKQTVQFIEGFRQLCQHGLILHHVQREFSLSSAGFELASSLEEETVNKELKGKALKELIEFGFIVEM